MESALCLILDENAKVYLPLCVNDGYKIDKFTMDFETASELRENYKEEIDDFLKQHSDYVKSMQYRLSNPKFNGWIVVLQHTGNDVVIKKALFKKHRKEFVAMCHDKNFMRRFLELEKQIRGDNRPLISKYVSSLIENNGTFDDEYEIKRLKNEIDNKNNKSFYELLRLMLKLRRFLDKNLGVTNDNDSNYVELIQQYSELKEMAKRVDTYAESKEDYYVNGVRFDADEQELFDLDDLRYMEDNEFMPDGLDKNGKSFR